MHESNLGSGVELWSSEQAIAEFRQGIIQIQIDKLGVRGTVQWWDNGCLVFGP